MGDQKTKLDLAGRRLGRDEMKNIKGGSCNPAPYYNKPCYGFTECGGTECSTTLYCYHANGNPYTLGVCLFR